MPSLGCLLAPAERWAPTCTKEGTQGTKLCSKGKAKLTIALSARCELCSALERRNGSENAFHSAPLKGYSGSTFSDTAHNPARFNGLRAGDKLVNLLDE